MDDSRYSIQSDKTNKRQVAYVNLNIFKLKIQSKSNFLGLEKILMKTSLDQLSPIKSIMVEIIDGVGG